MFLYSTIDSDLHWVCKMPSGAFDFPGDVAYAVRSRVLLTPLSGLVHKICSLKVILQKFIKIRTSQITQSSFVTRWCVWWIWERPRVNAVDVVACPGEKISNVLLIYLVSSEGKSLTSRLSGIK